MSRQETQISLQRLRQKMRRPHPHLQRAKRMLGRLAASTHIAVSMSLTAAFVGCMGLEVARADWQA
jgi:hypothetical protein